MKQISKDELKNKDFLNNGQYGKIYRIGNKIYKQYKKKHGVLNSAVINEITYLQYVNHPNVIKLLAINNIKGIVTPYYTMDLYDWVNKNPLYDTKSRVMKVQIKFIDTIKHIMKELANGLKYLHSQNILHGDIKEKNIMLDFSQSDGMWESSNIIRPIIIDFGLSNTNFDFQYMYTENYRPIEIWNENPYNFTADIWALGCVYMALLLGSAPFFPSYQTQSNSQSKPKNENEIARKNFYIKNIDYVFKNNLDLYAYTICPMDHILYKMFEYDIEKRISSEELSKLLINYGCGGGEGIGKNTGFGLYSSITVKNKNPLVKNVSYEYRAYLIDQIILYVEDYILHSNESNYNLYDLSAYCIYILELVMNYVSEHNINVDFRFPSAIVSLSVKFLTENIYDYYYELESKVFEILDFCMPIPIKMNKKTAKLVVYLLFTEKIWNIIDNDYRSLPRVLKICKNDKIQYYKLYNEAKSNIKAISKDYLVHFNDIE